jgi:type I restriction enzyme R subunit
MSNFTENILEQAIIDLFVMQGYEYSFGPELHRRTKDILFLDDLMTYLNEKYENSLTDNEIQKIINEISFISSNPLFDGNREVFNKINNGFSIYRDDSTLPNLFVELIDFKNYSNNKFRIINQYEIEDLEVRIPDILVFVNGIPLSIIEVKTAKDESVTIYDAWEQIHLRYTRGIPEALKYSFVSMITDGINTKLGTIFTPYEFYYAWKKEEDVSAEQEGIKSLVSAINGFYKKDRFIEILQDFIIYPDKGTKYQYPVICRYPQYFATKKLLDSIRNHMKPHGDGKGGTYFAATGSGKTYTMLFLARKLVKTNSEEFKNPTVVVIVDREDLDNQTTERFASCKKYLNDSENVKSIDSRSDLKETLSTTQSGGVFITTVQKFAEDTGTLSERTNIICVSDEAHRSQINLGPKVKVSVSNDNQILFTDTEGLMKKVVTAKEIEKSYGFAKYLHDSFPNATYLGFTGTPINETLLVFGGIVDSYTMKQSEEDGITVGIMYEPALARVILNDEQAKKIDEYYKKCRELGTNDYQVEQSIKDMTAIDLLLGHPDRLEKVAKDIITHYEELDKNKPDIVQKAMIVCSNRQIAFDMYNLILSLRPEWGVKKKTEDDSKYSKEQLSELTAVERIKFVATQGPNDKKELFDLAGTSEYRKDLAEIFKNEKSNFKIAVVVDMWLTGFDVPSLSVMYIDKPIQKHTLIQTISRVNRVFKGKDKGVVVDYIGFYQELLEAMKVYGNIKDIPIEEIDLSLDIFRNELALLDDLFLNFDSKDYFEGSPLEQLLCIDRAVEFVQYKKERETSFMGHSKRLKQAYQLVAPTGKLTEDDINRANYYFVIRSIIFKQTIGNTPDTETMNKHVQKMVEEAIQCSGVEIVEELGDGEDIFSDEFIKKIEDAKMPISKFNALVKLLKQAIREFGKMNKLKAIDYSEKLQNTIHKYNNRDNLVFVSETVADFVESLSQELIKHYYELSKDRDIYKEKGFDSPLEGAIYDILIRVRDDHRFDFDENNCISLAKEIKLLIDDKSQYTDYISREDTRNQLSMDLVRLLRQNGYPPKWNNDIFTRILAQVDNQKRNGF